MNQEQPSTGQGDPENMRRRHRSIASRRSVLCIASVDSLLSFLSVASLLSAGSMLSHRQCR